MKYDAPTLSDGTPVDTSQLCFFDSNFPLTYSLRCSLAVAWEEARTLTNFGCAMASYAKLIVRVDGAQDETEVWKQINAQMDARYETHRIRPGKSLVAVTTYRPAGTLSSYAGIGIRVLFPFESEPNEGDLMDWWLGLHGDKRRALVLYPFQTIGVSKPKRGPPL